MIRDYQRTLRPTAPTPPAPSFHPSSLTHDRSISATPIRHHHRQTQQMGNHATEEHIQNLTRELSQSLQFSPATTVLGSRPSGLHHPQPVPIPAGHTATPHDTGQKPTSNRLRLNLVWDLTTVNVWLDTAAPGEAFYDTFQQHFGKRKVIPDRTMLRIDLKCDKQCPDDQAYALSLDEDELDADWETTVSWLEENKRDKSPHIYGQVEIEGE
ncbi:hypothetical protein BKA63DRAFT_161502 [Paraphoma chrysanthemicola]|nr:hypothetical protein BKA63DRAFT_161502 [Paraphoma chrysanthemicola]